MTEQTNAITKGNGNIFAVSESDTRAARALKMMLPYGKMLTDDNALALYVFGKRHGLDPLANEVYFLVREKKDRQTGEVTSREELGCYVGIKGLRRKARESLIQQQGTFSISYEIASAKSLGMNEADTAIVMRAELRDTISSGQYLLNTLKLIQAGYAKDEVSGIIGKPPVVVGYGRVTTQEAQWAKLPPPQLARKRAEADAIKQRFDLGIPDDDLPEDVAPDIAGELTSGDDAPIEGEIVQPEQPRQAMSREQVEARQGDLLSEIGY